MSNQPNYQRMFEAACVALGEVGDALGCDPNEGGAEPILDAIEKLKAERNHWKANHDAQVQRARVLIDRPDIPLERVKAYEQIGVLTSERDEWKSKHFAFKDRDDMRNDAELYRHLRDHFAKTATDAKAEFARLEPLTGDAFDSVVRASMDAMGVSA